MENDSKEPLSKRPRVWPPKAQLEKDKETNCHGGQIESEPSIPTFTMDRLKTISPQEFLETYNMYQAVHFKVGTEGGNQYKSENIDSSSSFSWTDIGSIYQALSTSDKESWCIENHETNNGQREEKDTPTTDIQSENFLAPELKNMKAYCSFLVQKDKDAFQTTLQKLPLPNLGPIDEKWVYEPCLWVFFGRNNTCHVASATSDGNKKSGSGNDNNVPNDRSPLEGRGLHTDSVSHDGTWHYQLSGRKEWFISPSCDLLRHWKQQPKQQPKQLEEWDESTKVHVVCDEGEVLVINTRLWFHRTIIPHQDNPSVSYARDFRVESEAHQKEESTTAASPDTKKADEQDKNGCMTNVDGLYARTEIEAGTIIFTEKDMPECELHRSKDNPNCEVVELDDGTSAVVSRRTITCGEFFCVGDSSDEDEDEECEEEWSEDEGGDD